MSSFKHSRPLFVDLFLFVLLVFVSEAQTQPLKNPYFVFRSLYTFGDSFVDPGNNNHIPTRAKSNFPPYGRDFVYHTPTGRFSNGKLFPDFLAFYLGALSYQHPYLDQKSLNLKEPVTAVSFASATSGFDPFTTNLTNAIPMSQQLQYFKQYKETLRRRIGKRKAEAQIKNALFYVNAGSDDFAFSYFGDGNGQSIRQKTYSLSDYEQFLLQLIQQFIQGLSDQGARRIAVTGLPPLGCIPVGITRLPKTSKTPSSQRNCLDYVNSIASDFNSQLQTELEDMQNKLSRVGTKIAYIDFENPLLDVIQNPGENGFTEVNKGCCGTGLYEIGLLCNQSSPVCADASEYVFWDAAHPTEKMNGIIFTRNLPTINQIIKGYF